MENEFGAAIRVLLPSVELTSVLFPKVTHLIVTRQRDTLLEATVRVRDPAQDPAFALKPQCLIEVFRNMRFGPTLSEAVRGIYERRVLDRLPSQKTGVSLARL